MPKNLFIDPSKAFVPGKLSFPDIPVCQYSISLADERKTKSDAVLTGILEDMVFIREFETMLQKIKLEGSYEGIAYNNPGPAHLSIGQEASAVGQALHLTIEDHIYGSHRSHGEILAKGISAIRKLADVDLMNVMKTFDNGRLLAVVEKGFTGSVKDLAKRFLAYGALAEIFARETGFNQGLGGSMHAFFTPFGIYPNNALVGGSADIAVGAAYFKKINKKPGIVIANIGDGSMGCGPVWEALCMAGMAQNKELWDEAHRGGVPFILNVFNNHYAMGGQTRGETMPYDAVARIGAGVNAEGMHAERVNGYDPLAVAEATARKKQLALTGKGPILLEVLTYRIAGHSPSDASSYRTKEEIEAWQKADAINAYSQKLQGGKVIDAAKDQAIRTGTTNLIKDVLNLAKDETVSPRMHPEKIATLMFSGKKVEKHDDRVAEIKLDDNPRIKQIAGRERFFKDANGKEFPKAKQFQYADAIFEAMLHRYSIDPTMAAWGEENRDWGGAFACYRGLTEALPYHRLFNSPISEGAIVGSGVGYALEGGRAVVELMYCDFLGRAGDEVFNQMAKWQSMSAGVLKMPLTLRISVGNKYGAQHSQDWTAMCAHVPGLKIAFPATPYDAKGILNTALAGTDPFVYFESQRLYGTGEQFQAGGVPAGYYEVPEGEPALRKSGKDVTILTLGATLYRAMDAAKTLSEKYGVEAEVIDLRWLVPLNYQPLIDSVKKTGRVILVSDACERGSAMHTVATMLSRAAFGQLDAPPVVLGSRNWICPPPEMENDYFPHADWIVDAIHEDILPLKGHTVKSNQRTLERIRRESKGV